MTSFLWPSSPFITIGILVALYCLPATYLGLLSKLYIITYLLFMLIGYVFSSKRQRNRLPLVANRTSFALVTGASSGIGAQLCRYLVEHNFNLIMVARSERKLQNLAEELRGRNANIRIHVLVQDLTETDAVQNLTRQIDALKDVSLDIIINNAGAGCTKPFLQIETNGENFEQMVALHIRVPTHLIRHYAPQMFNRPSRIVNISSEISYISSPGACVYASTKAYLTQLTSALTYEFDQFNDGNHQLSLLLVTPGPTLNTQFDHHDQSVVFRLPFVTLTATQVAQQVVEACLRGDQYCTPGWFNQLTIWLMTKVPYSFSHVVCWLLWSSWSEVKQWLYERRHLILVCFNIMFLLLLLLCFLCTKIIRQFYEQFF